MIARLWARFAALGGLVRARAYLDILGDQFWLRPALVVAGCIGLAFLATRYDRATVDA